MKLQIANRNKLLNSGYQKLLKRRLDFALSRFEPRVLNVSVVLEDMNGPRGGIDKKCRISVVLKRAKEVVINNQDSNLGKCITRAAERMGRAVGRAIECSNQKVRTSPSNTNLGSECNNRPL